MLPQDPDFGSNGYAPPPPFGWATIGTQPSDPTFGNDSDLYFNTASSIFRTLYFGSWYDLGKYIGSLSDSSIKPSYFNSSVYGGTGTASTVSRSDHTHSQYALLSGGNNWNGYQSQTSGGWGVADYLTVFQTASNVALSLSSNQIYTTSSAGDYIQAYDINNSMRFKVDRIGTITNSGSINTAGSITASGNVIYYQTINSQSGSAYTLALTDANKFVTMTSSAANTITIPAASTTSWVVGTRIDIIQQGSGTTTISPASGASVNYYSPTSAATLTIKGRYGAGTLVYTATNTWIAIGNFT